VILDLSAVGGAYIAPPEEGDTYAANARIKARAAALAAGRLALADDSGIEVDALDGAPGVYSARYGGDGLDDRGRVALLLTSLAGIAPARRQAEFVCHLAVASPDGRIVAESEARMSGRVAPAPRGSQGFGYDPVFELPGMGVTMAELASEAKDLVSHRGRAAALLLPELSRLVVDFASTAP
jgi:XTP/dITP diphosphohydrolase